MRPPPQPARVPLRAAAKEIVVFSLVGGSVIALLKWTQYRFLVVEHEVALYGAREPEFTQGGLR